MADMIERRLSLEDVPRATIMAVTTCPCGKCDMMGIVHVDAIGEPMVVGFLKTATMVAFAENLLKRAKANLG